ncbi:MAG: NAD(P)-dependent oxidoreductase [Rhizobiales bacterium]|nr:NAD(P)-dependent oxidoreductase [Hyphomicrobiales bacterium]
MTILVTGSSGHLGEALMRCLAAEQRPARGLDIRPSPFTTHVGSITDREVVRDAMDGVAAVLHTATLHKPHVATHGRQDFIDVNISGTLNLLEEAVAAGTSAFVFTSTTSVFGDALRPPPGAPAAWITEDVRPVPRNIYGVTKTAAEDLVALFQKLHGLPGIVLRTSRFFPEQDDLRAVRDGYEDANAKANEFLHRRVDIEDVASAHLLALECAPALGFERFIISATTPLCPEDLAELRRDAASVVERRCPQYKAEYRRRGWSMFPSIDRVYDNARARQNLGWRPRHDFSTIIAQLSRNQDPGSPLARAIGVKGYHDQTFRDGPYPIS